MGSMAGMGTMEGTGGAGSGSASAPYWGPYGYAYGYPYGYPSYGYPSYGYPYTYAPQIAVQPAPPVVNPSPPPPHLSGTTVTIPRVTIPMSNNVPVAGARWPQTPNSRGEEGT